MLLIGIVGEERKFKGDVEKRVVYDEKEMKRKIFGEEEMEMYKIEEVEVKETEDGEFQKVEENSLEKVEKMENLFAVKVRFVEKTQKLSKVSELGEQVYKIDQNDFIDSEEKVKEFNSNVEKAEKQVELLLKEIADKHFNLSNLLKKCIIVDFEKPDVVDGAKERIDGAKEGNDVAKERIDGAKEIIDKNFVSELEKDLNEIFGKLISVDKESVSGNEKKEVFVVKESVSEFLSRKKTSKNETPKESTTVCVLVCSSRSAFDILFHEVLKISQDCFEYTFVVLSPEVSTSRQEIEFRINTFEDGRFLERISKDMGMLEVGNINRGKEWGFKTVHLCADPNRTVFFKLALCQFREFLIQKKIERLSKEKEIEEEIQKKKEEEEEKKKKKLEKEEEMRKIKENKKMEEIEESERMNVVCSECGAGASIMNEEVEKKLKKKLFINRIVGGTATAGFGFVLIVSAALSFLFLLNPIVLSVFGGSLILTCASAGATGLFEMKNQIDLKNLTCKFVCEKCGKNRKNGNSLKPKNKISP